MSQKLLIWVFILFTASVGVASAQTCKYEKNEVDKFTKKQVKITKQEMIYSKNAGLSGVDGVIVKIADYGESCRLLVNYIYNDKYAAVTGKSDDKAAGEGAKILFLMANDSTITAVSQEAGKLEKDEGYTVKSLKMEFIISKEDLATLSKINAKSFRITKDSDISQVIIEGDFPEKYQKVVRKIAKCIIE